MRQGVTFKNVITFLLILAPCLLSCLQACHKLDKQGKVGAGSATFSIQWPDEVNTYRKGLIPIQASAIEVPADCSTRNISSISARIADSSNTNIIAEGQWECSAHYGKIENIPAGTGFRITVIAIDAQGNNQYQGEKTGITITAGQNTNIGTVPLEAVQGVIASITSPSGNTAIPAGQSINFQGSATGGTAPYTYQWNFGGGASNSSVQSPGSVTFMTAGIYTVTLQVTDADGETGSTSVIITVNNPSSVTKGSFVSTGAMNQQRIWHSATQLPNGKVLIAGGATGPHPDGSADAVYNTAELYDPATGVFSYTGNLNIKRAWHTTDPGAPVTLLNNNLILITGGYDGTTSGYYDSSELYNPTAGTFTLTGSMPYISMHHSAIPLQDGRVLVAHINFSNTAIYDPSTGTFSSTGTPVYSRLSHTTTLLPNGNILITGGCLNNQPLASAELFNPESGTFSQTGSMAVARLMHRATLLPNGKVLITGGATSYSDTSTIKSSSEIYDPTTGVFTSTASMNYSRAVHCATLLLSGKVLLSGNWPYLAESELYDPSTGQFLVDASMRYSSYGRKATLLPDGRVLISGGSSVISELYIPATSPTDTAAPSNPSASINSGAATATSRKVTLNLSATDDTGVTGYYVSELSTAPLATLMTWVPIASTKNYEGNVPFYLTTGSGLKTVHVWFKDTAGNVSSGASSSLTLAL